MVANGSVLTRGYYLAARFGALFYSATEWETRPGGAESAGPYGVGNVEEIAEFGEEKLAVGAFGRAGGGPAGDECGGGVGGHGQRKCWRFNGRNEGKTDLFEGSTGQIGQIGQISLRLA